MLTRIIWELPAEASNVAFCRRAVRLLLEHHSVSTPDVDEAELIIGELCANVVRHAYDTQGGCLVVSIELDGLDLQMSVTDSGRGFDVPSLTDSPSFTENGGMGLFLMRAFADKLSVVPCSPHGSAVTASRQLRPRVETHHNHSLAPAAAT